MAQRGRGNIFTWHKNATATKPVARTEASTITRLAKDVKDLKKDLKDEKLNLSKTVQIPKLHDPSFENHCFELHITPDVGIYKGGVFKFTFTTDEGQYPFEPPKVKCTQKIYHPNIDLDGNVCLNILREDWTPALNLGSIVFGLQVLFFEPNSDDPLNKKAADDLRLNRDAFIRNVNASMQGGMVDMDSFDRVLK
ncbi:putative ubiquitin-conjugating enzyme E2 [Pyronema domesticum]|uniref:NEDD8-conjugating enzyme UBC12 n=1 Tax=Pyronema omphalodes (strain CBS 100304) TaxID=1076935 RepID=U4LTG2_PYROM|nr:putative ubiquitin-conjugating enzyme E2 [Pyronema domesticum]CCX32820.1 Similar to NEDD8-conjugating enzyme UBC12; acc. no. Q6C9W0 [Pyronema omphalodes CBS 100304]